MSAKRILHSILNFILILVAAIILWSCEKEVKISQEEEFIDYVSAYTTGIISRQSTIQVRLVQNYKGDESSAIPSSLGYLTFEPSIDGETYWILVKLLKQKIEWSLLFLILKPSNVKWR